MQSFARAVELFRQGFVQDAEDLCRRLLAANAPRREWLELLAEIQLATARAVDAVETLTTLTGLAPNDAAAWRRRGSVLLSVGRPADAIAVLRRALELDPTSVRAHNNLGQALLQTDDTTRAIRHFEQTLALDPHYAIGACNLGLALTRAGRLVEAAAALQRAMSLEPGLVIAGIELGKVLLSLGRPADALTCLDAVLDSPPADGTRPAQRASALAQRAAALGRLNRPAEALRDLEHALALMPTRTIWWCDRAVAHQMLGDESAADRCWRKALEIDADCALARAGLIAAQIPAVPASAAESNASRVALERELGVFEAWLSGREISPADAWTLARQQFFYLSYQEKSNRSLLQRYRRATARCLEFTAGERAATGTRRGRRFKLGIVSAHIQDHSVYNAIVHGWLGQLDRRRFEIDLFHLGSTQDAATERAAASADHFDGSVRTSKDWAATISACDLDAVIFPEIGIDRNTLALAHLRLAPRQLAAWGHPETSGLPSIDEFLSADAFEPAGAADHYSERLVRLPHLGVYYEPFPEDPAPMNFDQYGIPGDAPLLICPGAPFKYRPQDDAIWVEIARRLGRCTFAFFQHERAELSTKLRSRLTAAFDGAGLDAARFLVWLPWLPRPAFLGLLGRADVFLDTLGFSGFNTFMQAVQMNLPGVAFEGEFLRGRLGSGILRHLGLAELVAANPADYIAAAVKLAGDSAYRTEVRGALRSREPLAYRDARPIDALTQLLLD